MDREMTRWLRAYEQRRTDPDRQFSIPSSWNSSRYDLEKVSAVNNISGKVINTSLEPDVDFADTPYQEQSEISCKTVNHIQDEEEIDFSDSPANLDIEEEV